MAARKLIFIVSAAALALSTAASFAADKPKVGIVAVNQNSPTINRMVVTATEAAKAKGWTIEGFDGQGDRVATNNAAMGFIDRGFNAIINIASPNPQMTAVINRAKEKNIPFVSTFSGLAPNITADIGSNNTADGVISATELIGRLGGKGHIVKLNWRTGWDELVAPSVRAIEQAGKQNSIIVVSQDGIPEVFDQIASGGPAKLTVAYDVDRKGTTAVDVTAAALDGKMPASKLLTLAPCLVTKDTAPAKGERPKFGFCVLFSGEALAAKK